MYKYYTIDSFGFKQEPLKRTLSIEYSSLFETFAIPTRTIGKYFVSIPELVYVIELVNTYYDNGGLRSCSYQGSKIFVFGKEALYELPLGNINSTGYVCLANRLTKEPFLYDEYIRDVPKFSKQVISSFWQSVFNLDVYSNIIDDPDVFRSVIEWIVPIADPRVWQQKTRENPDWIPGVLDLRKSSISKKEIGLV